MMKIKLIFLIVIFNQIFAAMRRNCEISNYCGNESYGCSDHGNWNYKLFDYYKINSTEEDRLPHCDCFRGYSSYDITILKQPNNILCCYKKKEWLLPSF